MKLEIVTPSLSKSSGGVGAAVENLYTNMQSRYEQYDVEVLTLSGGKGERWGREYPTVPPARLGLSPSLLGHGVNTKADLIHTHGVWMATSAYQNVAHKLKGVPFVISPHGMLDPWILQRGKMQKMIARFFYENYAWKNCFAFHALNAKEADSIRAVVPHATIEVLPNGVDVLPYQAKAGGLIRLLFLGRLHEKKNLEGIVAAVNTITDVDYRKAPFVLDIVGWGDAHYTAQIKAMIAEGSAERFNWIGPAFGEKKQALLAAAHAFILPSFSEGMPVAVLEAWANGLSVLMSKDCNFPEALASGVALDSGVEVESIRKAILDYINLDEASRAVMSRRGYDYVASKYSWDIVCAEFDHFYNSVS